MTLPFGTATGLGPWPGTDEHEAARTIVGELGEFPHLAELPARGLGADAVGRAAAMLVDLPVDVSTTGYRLADRPGTVLRTARAHLARDLDAAEEACERAGVRGAGTPFKLQVCGPVTAAARLELRSGRRVLTDRGAVRDLTDSLAEGVREHVGAVRRRFGVQPVLQLDEDDLGAALDGALPGRTRYDPVRALPEPEARAMLGTVIEAAGGVPVILGGPRMPAATGLARGAGAAAITMTLHSAGSVREPAILDGLGEWLDSGRGILLGLAPAGRPEGPTPDWHAVARPAVRLVDELGFARGTLARQTIVTPESGLADADPDRARAAVSLACRIAAGFAGDPDSL